jgi:SAM-dependent methyltransferase
MVNKMEFSKMGFTNLVPDLLKPLLRPIYRVYIKITYRHKSRDELYQYWRQPWDGSNLPQDYLEGKARSQFLVEIMKTYANPDTKILEIGCNVGRNLNHLFLAGFKNLEGVEISEKAVQLLKDSYLEMASHIKIYNMPIEEIIKEFRDDEFDIVFTMAVLEHIHTDSEWIFPEIVRITKDFMITIEDEIRISWRHFPRHYKKIFEPLGLRQIQEINCNGVNGLGGNFFARVFKKV